MDKPQILDAAPGGSCGIVLKWDFLLMDLVVLIELTDAAATESAPKKRWVKAFGQWDAADSGPGELGSGFF